MLQIKSILKLIEFYSERLEMWKTIIEEEAVEKGLLSDYWKGKFEEYRDCLVNGYFPSRLAECQKYIDRFSKAGFTR